MIAGLPRLAIWRTSRRPPGTVGLPQFADGFEGPGSPWLGQLSLRGRELSVYDGVMRFPQPSIPATITVTSPEFTAGAVIPARFTCRGERISPAFSWRGVPAEAKQLAVVVSDPDAPLRTFLHWLVTGLPATDGGFEEGAAPAGGRQWTNSGGKQGWYPPCPPFGTHRYFFQVFALDAPVDGNTSKEALRHIDAHTIAWGSLMGTVSR